MMKRFLKVIGITLFGVLISMDVSAQIDDLRKEINKIIKYDTDLVLEDNPGFIISVIDQDSIYPLPFGNQYSDRTSIPSDTDIYEIGSITKSFTALLTIALYERGYLSLDDPINNHFHSNYKNPRLESITIHDLLTHSSGFPKHPDLFGRKMKDPQNPYKHYTKQDLLKYFKAFIPEEAPHFEYSHTNFALLEIILENATGSDLQELMAKYIWNPMKMNQTYIEWNMESAVNVCPGYDKAYRIVEPWEFSSFAASEGMKTSAHDLSQFVLHQINEVTSSLENTILLSQEIQIPKSINKSISTAYGWQIFNRNKDGYPIYTYSGRTSGHNAFIAYVKETKTAVIILSNSVLGTEDLGLQVLRLINYNWKRKV